MKLDGCIPYGFKVYVDKTNDLIVCLNNFQTLLHSFQRACGDTEYTHTHTHQREGERIHDARVIHRKKKKKKKKKKNRKSAREEKGSAKEAESIG